MRGGQEGPSKKLSALKWGSECTSSRQIPGGSIQQPPRRLPGLRCETRTCPLQALLCEGREGSWGAVPESQKSQAGMPHTAPPDLDFHSTQLPLPPRPPPPKWQPAGVWAAAEHARRQHKHQGQGQHRTTSGKNSLAGGVLCFLPGRGGLQLPGRQLAGASGQHGW